MTNNETVSKGWNTSDEYEIELRKLRGVKEKFSFQKNQDDSFSVNSSNGTYSVEIRSLNDRINSCGCHDFKINGLGTCKHIEAVLFKFKKKIKNSSKAEIYLSLEDEKKIKIYWPNNIDENIKALLNPFFSSDSKILSDPVLALSSIKRLLDCQSDFVKQNVNVSSHLLDWANEQKKIITRQKEKEIFLKDVNEGKRSLDFLKSKLYPYQEEGMLHLTFQGRAILADEMGLGKTIQAIGACVLLKKLHNINRVLVISPASLKGEWEEQIIKFCDLPVQIIEGTRGKRLLQYKKDFFFSLASYEQIRFDFKDIQEILSPDLIILDEAQRIKNWHTQTAKIVKKLNSTYAFVLTGTPVENRIDEIYSIVQFVDPNIFKSLFRFNRDFYSFDEKGNPKGYKNLNELNRRLNPILCRRLKKDVEEQLPERTTNNYYVRLHEEQIKRYDEYKLYVSRLLSIMKKRPLKEEEMKELQRHLACMRMVADSPYILDDSCKISPKIDELEEILSELISNPENKIIIFSEWERMLMLVKEKACKLNLDFAWHTGSIPPKKRREEIKRFKEDLKCKLFLSTDSGSMGLNLQAANIVINLDLPWNPARLEQRIARAWRKNQTRKVQVINLIAENCIEHSITKILALKQILSDRILDSKGDFEDMDIPSARASFIQKMEKLLNDNFAFNESKIQKSKKEIDDVVKEDILSRFNERVHLLEVYEDKDVKTVFVVVDKKDENIEFKINETLKQGVDLNLKLEILDYRTFEIVSRLMQRGIISSNNNKKTLHKSSMIDTVFLVEREKKLKESQSYFSKAEYQMKMALFLASGGFVVEAKGPAISALDFAVRSLRTLEEPVSADIYGLIEKLKEESKNENEYKNLIDQSKKTIENLCEKINFAML